ncbi:uncharacterized protein PRCAT00000894001 [Priceomyces carsonii]|uniref:uncharacterized protein n=1 Tax=Priceomyces carsonii TaxID=28549 RepID=UPI002EDAE708|nr:unnamed protein product [Priceomyces carsonii]
MSKKLINPNPFGSAADALVSESRRRQSKRDDAIRRKIENDLNKKRKQGAKSARHNKASPGTVLSLKPSEPIICKATSTVYEVSQQMTARRENCVLVINAEGELLGIFTAKDLAFRIVGSGLNANTVTIDQIMTPNPLCANANAPASDALDLMVQKGFRHLPVLDDNNQIAGVLDITKCYAQQMEKLERMYASSKKLYEALDSVNSEMGMLQQPAQVFQYFENLKNKMNGPTLENVLDSSTVPIYTNVKATVYDATVLMRENRTTAVLVNDMHNEVSGIFTSKDVVLRVIAAGLDPKKCSIVRVMTPQPDVAKVSLPIQQALRQMFEGHYLNLPIVDEGGNIIGIVDVLKLTYVTLNQIKQIESTDDIGDSEATLTTPNEGPAWHKFWTSLDNEDTESINSDPISEGAPNVTTSELQSFNIDIKPSDSISKTASPSKTLHSRQSFYIPEEVPFTFKFKSPALEGRVHRISCNFKDGFLGLRDLIAEKLLDIDYEALSLKKGEEEFAISYVDDEGDIVSITSDADLVDCIKINLRLNNDKADLYIHNSLKAAPVNPLKLQHDKKKTSGPKELIPGLPNEILLPTALVFLASSFIVGFSLSRK